MRKKEKEKIQSRLKMIKEMNKDDELKTAKEEEKIKVKQCIKT